MPEAIDAPLLESALPVSGGQVCTQAPAARRSATQRLPGRRALSVPLLQELAVYDSC